MLDIFFATVSLVLLVPLVSRIVMGNTRNVVLDSTANEISFRGKVLFCIPKVFERYAMEHYDYCTIEERHPLARLVLISNASQPVLPLSDDFLPGIQWHVLKEKIEAILSSERRFFTHSSSTPTPTPFSPVVPTGRVSSRIAPMPLHQINTIHAQSKTKDEFHRGDDHRDRVDSLNSTFSTHSKEPALELADV